MLIQCPSGLSFHARKWKIKDRRNLHNPQTVKQGLLMRKMLEAVDEGVESPGPYDFDSGKPARWSDVCITDIIDALVAIRVQTKPEFEYTDSCAHCGAQIPMSVDLREVEARSMSKEGKTYLHSKDLQEFHVATKEDGSEKATIKLQMLYGRDTPRMTQMIRKDPEGVVTLQIIMHIKELVTPEGETLTRFRDIQTFYEDQDWFFHEDVDNIIDSFGGGVDTVVNIDCPRCNAEQEGALPFGVEFYYPKRSVKRTSSATP